jgi:Ca-activated chloride channel family protein
MTLTIRTDRQLIRAHASSSRYVLVTCTAPEAPARAERLPVNVALVLDRSGSMSGARKFVLARDAVEQSLRMLRPDDRFALVVYDQQVDVLARSTYATADARRRALDALRDIEPRGSTDLCAGWMRGCEQIAEHLAEEGICRALLLTDGLANHGTQDRATLARHAGELRRRGIATSTFGVGEDFDERLLRDMAHEGGGNFYFIESAAQIADVLTSELGEALEVVARDAQLRIALPRGASAEPLNRFRHSLGGVDDRELRIDLGNLVSGQDLRAVVRVQFPRGSVAERQTVHVTLEGSGLSSESAETGWTYASHGDNDHQPRDREVDREVALLYAARARAAATEANRAGDFDAAERVLVRTADRISRYAGEDAVLREQVSALRGAVARFAREEMDPAMLKASFFLAETAMRFRSPEGKARRRE